MQFDMSYLNQNALINNSLKNVCNFQYFNTNFYFLYDDFLPQTHII